LVYTLLYREHTLPMEMEMEIEIHMHRDDYIMYSFQGSCAGRYIALLRVWSKKNQLKQKL